MNAQKIELTKKEKEIFLELIDNSYRPDPNDSSELEHLEYLGLGTGLKCEFGGYLTYELTNKAKAYVFENPKLKNPSIFDDKKFWVEIVSNLIS